MSRRPTPETDAAAMQPVDRLARAYTFHGTEPFKYSTNELVPAEFARNLERERDEARDAIRALAEHGESEIQRITKERDKAREERDKLKQLLAADSERVDAYLGVCIERDEAREQLSAAKREAEYLATSIHRAEYSNVAPNWGLCDSVAGVISQIDNMYAGVREMRDEARNKMADALQEVDLRTLDFERMKQERDEAINRYEEISRIFDGANEEEWKSCTTLGETVARILRERDEARKA